jgi:hypothetical protein
MCWIVGWCVYFYISSLRTPLANDVWTDIAGEYSLSLADVRGEAIKGYPFLDIDIASAGGTVTVTQEDGSSVSFSNQMKNEQPTRKTFDVAKQPNLFWNEGCLVYHERKMGIGGILFGWIIQSGQSVLKKDIDGNLQIKCDQQQKGLVLFLLPFSEHLHSFVLLRAHSPTSPGKDGVVSGHRTFEQDE